MLQLLTWAGHNHVTVSTVVALWQAVNGSGGKEEVMWQCLSHSCHIWVTGAEGRIYFTFVFYITKPLWLRWLKCSSYWCGSGFNFVTVQNFFLLKIVRTLQIQ